MPRNGEAAYRHHPLALKRSIVEETLQPGASVARIDRQHGINANHVFLWRKAYREGLLPEFKADAAAGDRRAVDGHRSIVGTKPFGRHGLPDD